MLSWEIIPQCEYTVRWPSYIILTFVHLVGIFPLLTGISIFCLANNHSSVFRNVFGGASNNEGMGLLSWSLDWNLIGSNCLFNPLWLQINQDIGIILTYILMSAVYYGNLWNAKAFPFMSQAIFVRIFPPDSFLSSLISCPSGLGWIPVQPNSSPHERQVRRREVRGSWGPYCRVFHTTIV